MAAKKKVNVQFANPKYYNNREISWLAFNKRVLEEAMDVSNPLLERLKFLAIVSSNLDEFFMVRVAGLKDQVKSGINKAENKAGLTPKQQLEEITVKTHKMVEIQYNCFHTIVKRNLEKEGILFSDFDRLSKNQRVYLEKHYDEKIFPVLTPLKIDPNLPFPMILNKSVNIVIDLENKVGINEYPSNIAIVQIPDEMNRFIVLKGEGDTYHVILLEDLIEKYLHKLFRGYKVKTLTHFRITRNADIKIHEKGERDLIEEIEKKIEKRKYGNAVRLEATNESVDGKAISNLIKVLDIHEEDVYRIRGPLDLSFLFSLTSYFAAIKEHLTYPNLIPQPPKDLKSDEGILHKALDLDLFLHHPYESFEPVIQFVEEAAEDPHVLAIKHTLYRVSGDSPLISALKLAAKNGKKVTVLVELKARFDEENNVQWAKELEKSGCHVIYGIPDLKTHSKITLIEKEINGEIKHFVHLGTGNYNDQTAKIYTDMSLITTKRKFGIDATNFFHFLGGYSKKPEFYHLSISPFDMKKKFIQLIQKEIKYQKKFNNGKIIAKMNSLTDKNLIMKFYEASQAGVQIDLIVRGICCLRPGLPGVSENIRVRSIVGRYLEHSRIYSFFHNGEQRIYLSSADMMNRNMKKRVELLFPVFDESIKKRIILILSTQLSDNVKARVQDSKGNYHFVKKGENEPDYNSQLELYKQAYNVLEEED